MIYQLPNGKIINITIEQYLELTDEDIQYLMSINFGEYASSPWVGSAIKKKRSIQKNDEEPEDRSIDYVPEEEDGSQPGMFPFEETPLEDIPDIPDESTLD